MAEFWEAFCWIWSGVTPGVIGAALGLVSLVLAVLGFLFLLVVGLAAFFGRFIR